MRLSEKGLINRMNKAKISSKDLAKAVNVDLCVITHIRDHLFCPDDLAAKIVKKLNCQVVDIQWKDNLVNRLLDAKKYLAQFRFMDKARSKPYRDCKNLEIQYLKSKGIVITLSIATIPATRNILVNDFLALEINHG